MRGSPRSPQLTLRRLALGLAASVLTLAGTAGTLAASAGPAQAAPQPWGFAHVNTSVLGPLPDLQRQATGSGAVVQLTAAFGGQYEVRFPGVGAPRGVVHVTAISGAGNWCQVRAWAQVAADELVRVDCYRPGGVLAPTNFSVVLTGTREPAPGGHAYVHTNPAGGLLSSFNSSGGANVVTPVVPGMWRASIQGFGAATRAGNVQVTAVNAAMGARCKVTNWWPAAASQELLVSCRDAAGSLLDTNWTLSYTLQRSILGVYPPRLFAYCLDTGTCAPSPTSYNNLGCANSVISAGLGLRLLEFTCVGMFPSHVTVTSFGDGPQYCGLLAPWGVGGGNSAIIRDVVCYEPSGAASPTTMSSVAYTGIQ
ncbi:hypothetical protein [Flindersiella endophytica]